MDREEEAMEDYMKYYDDVNSASIGDMESHVDLDTDNCSSSVADMTDIQELYNNNGSSSMDNIWWSNTTSSSIPRR
jgi:hypothetical protein